jgi:hypothetical protein
MVDHVLAIMGTSSLSISISTFDENKTLDLGAYDQLLQENPSDLLKDEGLIIMASYNPESIQTLLDQAISNVSDDKFCEALSKALIQNFNGSSGFIYLLNKAPQTIPALLNLTGGPSGAVLRSGIARALVQTDALGQNGLQEFASHAPQLIPELLTLAEGPSGRELRSALANALIQIDSRGFNGLVFIAANAPQSIPELLKLAEGDSGTKLRSALSNALLQKNSNEQNGLSLIANYAPQCIPQLVQFAKGAEGKSIQVALGKALTEVDKTTYCPRTLLDLIEKAPEHLPALFDLEKNWLHSLTQSPTFLFQTISSLLQNKSTPKNENLRRVLEALAATETNGMTAWHRVHKSFPESKKLSLLNNILLPELDKLDDKDLMTLSDDLGDALTNNKSPYHGLCKERHQITLFRTEPYGKTALWATLLQRTQAILQERGAQHTQTINTNR